MLHHQFTPSFVIDVTSVWSLKLEALRAHESQLGSPNQSPPEAPLARFLPVLDARSIVHGSLIGVERGEAFACLGPVPLVGLPGLDHEAAPQ
jgi:LmbE family N-acetylglucosaminyl deacetylase